MPSVVVGRLSACPIYQQQQQQRTVGLLLGAVQTGDTD